MDYNNKRDYKTYLFSILLLILSIIGLYYAIYQESNYAEYARINTVVIYDSNNVKCSVNTSDNVISISNNNFFGIDITIHKENQEQEMKFENINTRGFNSGKIELDDNTDYSITINTPYETITKKVKTN